jgi:hypothetical protein
MSHQTYNIFDGTLVAPFARARGMSKQVACPKVQASRDSLPNARKEMGK